MNDAPKNTAAQSDLPVALAKPAQRALAAAGYRRLEQLTEVSEAQLKQLHGIGPKALDQLRQGPWRQGAGVRRRKERQRLRASDF